MLNEKRRLWTNTEEGKEYQRKVFEFMYDWRISQMKYGDGKYDWMAVNWVEAKLESEGLEKSKIVSAIQRLEEHSLIKMEYHSRGQDVRIMKKGWERWEKQLKKKVGAA